MMISDNDLEEMTAFAADPSQLQSSPRRDQARDLLGRASKEIVRLRTDNQKIEEYAKRISDLQSENEELQAMTARAPKTKKGPGLVLLTPTPTTSAGGNQ